MRNLVLAILLCLAAAVASPQVLDPLHDYRFSGEVVREGDGTTKRSTKVINAFKRQWPCPVNGKRSGACPGWAIDHIIPLACGGVDAVYNLQWLPNEIKSAKGAFSKDHFERRVYGGSKLSEGCP
jgi:hypothetical protein